MDFISQLKGKLSISPEDALTFFNFKLKEGAKGIIFCRRNNKTYMRNWFPHKKQPNTPEQLKWRNTKFFLSSLASEHLKDIIWPIWEHQNRQAKKFYSGFNMFISVNLKGVNVVGGAAPQNWTKLLISLGPLERPYLRKDKASISLSQNQYILEFFVKPAPIYKLGIAVFNFHTQPRLSLLHIPPQKYTNPISISIPSAFLQCQKFILYLYFQSAKKLYSNSTASLFHIGETGFNIGETGILPVNI